MAKKAKKKLTGHERRRKKSLIIVGMLAMGLILTTLLAIFNTALS